MSLINQMLKDLEERSAPQLDEHADTIKGVAWTAACKTGRKRRYLLAGSIASVLCTGIAAASYYHLNSEKDSRTNKGVIEQTTVVDEKQARMSTGSNTVPSSDISSRTETTDLIAKVQTPRHLTSEIAPADVDTRKMLAALVARGALAEQKQVVTEKAVIAQKPVQLAAAQIKKYTDDKKNINVQKKLRPLDNSKLAEIAYQQGYDLISRGQQALAEQKLLHAIGLVATHTKAREMLAVMYLQQQRITEAGELLKQGMVVAPRYLSFREIYARVLMAENKLTHAIEMLNTDAPDLAREPNYHALIAGLYQQNQQHEQAASKYLNLIKKNPRQSQWWLGMAISLEKIGKNNEAVSAYKKARELKLPARLMKYAENRLRQMDSSDVTQH